jgi:hypothetical protein
MNSTIKYFFQEYSQFVEKSNLPLQIIFSGYYPENKAIPKSSIEKEVDGKPSKKYNLKNYKNRNLYK